MAQVKVRKQKIVERFRESGEKSLEDTKGLELIRGEASFVEDRSVKVRRSNGAPLRLRAEKIFLNTGARPAVPPIDGLDRVPFLDSTSIMELNKLPERLVIIGGGYIAVEFGQMFRRYGSQVTMLERKPQLLGALHSVHGSAARPRRHDRESGA